MFFKLFLIFAVVPVIELALLIRIGSIIGTLNTIIIVILTAIIGAYPEPFFSHLDFLLMSLVSLWSFLPQGISLKKSPDVISKKECLL